MKEKEFKTAHRFSNVLLSSFSTSIFLLMFGIVSLLNVNYNILRSARNALVVVDLGHGAGMIPFFELVGTLPASILMAYLLTRLLNRFSMYKVFLIGLSFFISFFLLFATVIYPLLPALSSKLAAWNSLPYHLQLSSALPQLFSMIFFVMAELWKIALLTVLFWGLINQHLPLKDAKKYYAPLMLGGSLGTIVSGPLISLCTSNWISHQSWMQSLISMMLMLAAIGILTGYFYSKLWKSLAITNQQVEVTNEVQESFSLWESIQVCLRSRYLLLLAWLTISDYIAYSLGEVVFLEVLKERFPDPREYCDFMGKLSLWQGILTAFSALFISPYLFFKSRWLIACLITPACLLLTECAFFFVLGNSHIKSHLELSIILGSLFFCLVRAAKYTLFDTSKEISFVPLSSIEKMQGKLVIDGMCSRLGRGGASLISLLLIQCRGGVLAGASLFGWLGITIALSCVISTCRLGKLFNKASAVDPLTARGIEKLKGGF